MITKILMRLSDVKEGEKDKGNPVDRISYKFTKNFLKKTLILFMPVFFFFQCKKENQLSSKKGSLKSQVQEAEACAIESGDVKEAFGLVNVNKIDASKLTLSEVGVVQMEFTEGQDALVLDFREDSVDSNPDLFPDFVRYKITNSKNAVCEQGETGSSLFEEIFLRGCQGELFVEAKACAVVARRKDINVDCGPSIGFAYEQKANEKSNLSGVISYLQQNERELEIIASWVSFQSLKFLDAIKTIKDENLSQTQTLLKNLAILYSTQESDFKEIYTSELYEELIEISQLQQEALQTEGGSLGLSEGSKLWDANLEACLTENQKQGQKLQLTEALEDLELDLEQILADSREKFGASDEGDVELVTATDTDEGEGQSGEIVNDAEKKEDFGEYFVHDTVPVIIGGLVLVGGVWAAYPFLRNGYKEAKRLKVLGNVKEMDFIDVKGKPAAFAEGKKTKPVKIKTRRIQWVTTPDGKAQMMTYKGKVVVRAPDGKFTLQELDADGAKQLKELKSLTSKIKNTVLGTQAADVSLPENIKGEIVTNQVLDPKTGDMKKVSVSPTDALKNANLMKGRGFAHLLGGATLAVLGGGLFYKTYIDTPDSLRKGESLELSKESSNTQDPFQYYSKAILAGEKFLNKLKAENQALQELKTNLVVDSLLEQ